MFGRYSLDKSGLILASQGETLDDYYAQIPDPSFEPDADNVIPVTETDCFEDDIVTRFASCLTAAFGRSGREHRLHRAGTGQERPQVFRERFLQRPREDVLESSDLLAVLQPNQQQRLIQGARVSASVYAKNYERGTQLSA